MNTNPRLKLRSLLSLFMLGLAVGAGSAATITRGPYLQQNTTNGVTLRWRTDVATDSRLRYGTSAGVFAATNSNATVTTEHALAVGGLLPDTKYFYELGGAGGWFSGDANDFFVTSPPTGSAKPTRLWVLGDSGTANANAAAVRNGYLTYSVSRPADLMLMLGDNAYTSGTDPQYQAAVFDMYPTVLQNTPLWSTIGNHDTASSTTPPPNLPYFNIFTLPQNAEAGGVASGTEKYYSFDYANIHFVCLDAMTSDRGVSGPMNTWLAADLATTAQDWIIAFWHHPPYSKGSHDSDLETELIQMRQNAVPILESYGVDLVLCGHSHAYERSFLIDGHYGNASTLTQSMKKNGGDGRESGNGAYAKPEGAPNQGAVYVVAGSSGQVSGGALNHPAMFISLNQLGSLVIDVNSNRLDLVFLKTDAIAGDSFTMLKTPPATNSPAPPASLTASAVASSQINLAWLDNATDEDGFKVERATNIINFAQFATVGANVTSGADNGLSPNTTYYYRLRAFNTAGDSPYSGIAQATTFNGPLNDTLVAAGAVWKYLDNGSNQGAAWTAPGFNDTAWASGGAELGYGDGGEVTVLSYGPNANAKFITTYFRRAFNAGNPVGYTNLALRLMRDDGAVVYVNGREVFRSNMPGGAVNYTTLATTAVGGADESTFFSANISPTNLVAGANLLAVELHQSAANSSDISFNLELIATGPPPSSGDTTPPATVANLTVGGVTGTSVMLLWTAPGDDGNSGTAASYDVRTSTSLISEANWASATPSTGEPAPSAAGNSQAFTVNGLTPGSTYYFALKTADEAGNVSPLSNIPSAATPISSPTAPTALAATAVSASQIDLAWTDGANNESGFKIERSINGVNFAQINTVGANITGFSDTGLASATTYWYRARAYNAGGDSGYSNISQATTPAAPTPPVQTLLVATNSVWRYLDNGSDQGTAWSALAFNDSTWSSGPAELGYGDGGEATAISFGPNANNKYITTYFRHSFSVANAGAYTNLALRLLRDDGAVVFLNGTEIFRSNLPGGPVSFATLASTAIGGADESTFYAATIPPSALVDGVNVLAVEIHQANATSSDLGFALELIAVGPPGTAYVTGRMLGTLRNDYSGFVGMKIGMGTSPITVTALGRIFVAGNSGTHIVKLVNVANGTDVPGGSVSLSMSGGTAGQFKYATLSNPVVLAAGTTYYLASQETAGGDYWHNYDTTVTTTSVATELSTVYSPGGGAWIADGSAGQTFGPVDFKYTNTTDSLPPSDSSPPGTAYVTGRMLGTLRNDYSGFVGMKIGVGTSPITVTALGRIFVAGNSGTHIVKLVNVANGTDVPGGSVSLSMSGGTAGQFKYATLSNPVVLAAGTTYYLASQETAGGDYWHNYDTTVTTTSVATELSTVYSPGGGAWIADGSAGQTFGPVDFKYTNTTDSLPPSDSSPPGTAYVTGRMLGTLRNDYSGFVGMKIGVGTSPITVTALGRIFVAGNSGTHIVKLVNVANGTDVPGGSVSLSMSGGTAGQFKYATLSNPVVLAAGTTYYLASQETAGGDYWHNYDTTVTTTSVATELSTVYSPGGGAWIADGSAGQTFGPVDFKY